jgi:uncharacterized UBP type Zn finger protein
MALMAADADSAHEINPFIFHRVCGTMFTGNENIPMSGETQEDAHEFIIKLLDQPRKEQPEVDIDEIFAAQFAEQQVCKCGATKTFTEEGCNLNIPKRYRSSMYRVPLELLLGSFLDDKSKFAEYRCEECGESGKWSTTTGWERKRMTRSPEFLIVNLSRGESHTNGHLTQEVKLATKIKPPVKNVSIKTADGTRVQYHLVAMIKHEGKE